MNDYYALLFGFGFAAIAVVLIIAIAMYVLTSYSHMKALNALGYDKAWLAWIPFGVWYACADAVSKNEEKVRMFDSFDMPAFVFKFWWIAVIIIYFIPALSILNVVLQVVFLGSAYAKMYARIEGTSEKDNTVIGCLSGFLQIIAVVKFLMIKKTL